MNLRTVCLAHEEKLRYLLVGGWNTLFGYVAFVALYYLVPFHYMIIVIISNIVAITNAYLCYKFLVFRTRGHYLREYLKFYVVYGTSMIMGITMLSLLVELLRLHPVAAQTIIVPVGIVISFIGHKYFSFSKPMQ